MRSFALFATLVLCTGIASAEEEPILGAGGSGMDPLDENRTVVWQDLPNLDGWIGSSEQILEFGLETELANDLLIEAATAILGWTWWGGYYAYVPGDPLAQRWIMRVYQDAGCAPFGLVAEFITADDADQTYIYDQGGYPIYEYTYCVYLDFTPGQYWFGAIAADHPFPPEWGRLAAVSVQLCDSVFKGAYFAFPDWTPAIEVFGQPYDASQRFEDNCPNPTPIEETTWGSIKGLY